MVIKNPEGLQDAAKTFLRRFPFPGVFAFYGEMGAGKTTFIKALCRELQVQDTVTSPSFALVNEYRTKQGEMVFHFDFYRIKSIREAFDLGYEEYFFGASYCFIEWPEKIEELLPETVVNVNIKVLKDGSRDIEAERKPGPE